MPDDVGGQPFPDGEGPEYRHHGDADEEFAPMVFDEAFVRAAEVHEPTAAERILAAAQSHGELTDGTDSPEDPQYGPEDTQPQSYGFGTVYGWMRPGAYSRYEPDPDPEPDADEDTDDEGRFDRSHYGEFPELDDPDPDAVDDTERHYGPYGAYGHPGHYGGYGQYGGHGPYPRDHDQGIGHGYGQLYGQGHGPDFVYGDEHGSDYGYRHGPQTVDPRPYRGHARWQRPVAWVLAVVMGIGVVALAFSALHRGTSSGSQDPTPPPATTGVGASGDPP